MNVRNFALASLAVTALAACGEPNDPELLEQQETDAFRQALVSEDDVKLDYSASGSAQALNGQYSLLAGLTADAVIGTNAFMIGHFVMMHFVAHHEPTESGEDYRVWEGENDGITVRVRADRSETPRGFRYDYSVSGKPVDSDADFLTVIDGHVVRFDEAYEPRDGFGIVRFHFDNLNTLEPEREIDGKARVSFRKANKAHQVHVRFIDVKTPEDPHFPSAAEYRYAVASDESGALQWFSRGDVKKDGEPYEDVAVHTVWRADKSGIGSGFVTGGSLEVDYWHLLECWDSTFIKGFDMLSIPGLDMPSGDAASCFATPEDLEVPSHTDELPDEDPEIPAPMPGDEDATDDE